MNNHFYRWAIGLFLFVATASSSFANTNLITQNSNTSSTPSVKDTQMAINDLMQMSTAIRTSNYSLYFNVYNDTGLDEYKFTNYYVDNKRYATLTNLEGKPYSVYLKNGLVGNSKYALKGDTFEILPNIFNANFSELSQNYIIQKSGTSRVANRQARVYDITNKFANLYSYQVAVDNATNLPLKVVLVQRDLVNNSYTILSSFTVVYLETGIYRNILETIKDANINTGVVYDSKVDKNISKQFEKIVRLNFLPAGFKLVANNQLNMYGDSLISNNTGSPGQAKPMLAQTYSDGLFSFTIYVSKNPVTTEDHYYWVRGDTTMYAEDYAGHKLIIVGQLPLSLAKGIINSLGIFDANGVLSNKQHPNGYGQQLNTN
ncbi:MucB/RseB C-terminal domain-containing protein [Psittacicella hinzii]|uniref:Sigma E regulatory protein, MucB/RseB n=1 Tax=Psittacicella hinzii TaxID=2028575 RepID=A0A3A1YBT7_9GAMM|nr:MucB/RseB C-terminal domain-containing protein [Psittacicella hinzii]RIY35733.1 hypothetical protein CKF58_06470 [Psittacicella hinzii]